jgi:hypothetical protein
MSSTASAKLPPASDQPKTLWDSILTSTPVVLTVIATLLAGLSSSEMTRAQYHRSLAAQHQSKAGDQWSFFQAKRIRGGNTEMGVDLLRAQHALVPVTADAIAEYAARLSADLNRVANVAERLLKTLDAAKVSAGDASLRSAVEKLIQVARRNAEEAQTLQQQIAAALSQADVRESLSYLNTDELPKVETMPVGGERIEEARRAILARKTEAETASLMATISDNELRTALDTAEANAHAFEEKGKPADKGLAVLARLIQEGATLSATVHRLAERAMLAVAEAAAAGENADVRTASAGNAANGLRSAATALERTDAALMKTSAEMQQSFLAARRDFTARRYEREARDNQTIAGVFEIQVRKSSWDSERHRNRSQHFFLGMLLAQAGVTIATFALALRQRSVLWVLATVAGLAAIAFSAYVYLYT